MKMISLSERKCIRTFEGHRGSLFKTIPLSDDLILTTCDDKTARLWSSSDGTTLQTLHFGTLVWSGIKLNEDHFALGLYSGEVHIFRLLGGKEAKFVTCLQAHCRGINDFSVWKDRFATACLDGTAKIWDAYSFECLWVFKGHADSVRCIEISDSYIATGSFDETIRIYDAKTPFDLIRVLSRPKEYNRGSRQKKYIRCIRIVQVGENQCFVSCSDDGIVSLFEASSGEVVWSKQVGGAAYPVTVTVVDGGNFVCGLNTGEVVEYKLPPSIGHTVRAVYAYPVSVTNMKSPLVDAWLKCFLGLSSPKEHCDKLINYRNCSVSFPAWCSAVRILKLAVEDGSIERDTQYNGNHSHWYEQFIALKDIPITDTEYGLAKKSLQELKELKVIECIDAVLTAVHVTADLRETRRELEISFKRSLQDLKADCNGLRIAFELYQKSQKRRQLISVALQVIPIVGGAVIGVASAGADIASGLSVKDVADYALDLCCHVGEDHLLAKEDLILKTAADSLRHETVTHMESDCRENLQQTLRSFGHDPKSFRELFSASLKNVDDPMQALDITAPAPGEEAMERTAARANKYDVGFRGEEAEVGTRPILIENPDKVCIRTVNSEDFFKSSERPLLFNGYHDGEVENLEVAPDRLKGVELKDVLHREYRKDGTIVDINGKSRYSTPKLRGIRLNTGFVQRSCQEDIAACWAACVFRGDTEKQGRFALLRERLLTTLKLDDNFGTELTD